MAGPREIAKAEARQRAEAQRLASRQETLAIRARVDADNAAATKAAQEQQQKALGGAPENKDARTTGLPAGQRRVVPVGVQNKRDDSDAGAGLDAVAFASPQARQAAVDAGLSAEDFKRRRRGSESGFNVADVDRIAGARGADEGAEE